MRRLALIAVAAVTLVAAAVGSAGARPETLMDLLAGRDTPACPRYQRTPRDPCNIVVKRPGGNPTQDMTGSIGHAKSYWTNGGPRCKTICRFTGTQY
ncbi:hypothetical protein [Methylobacterium aerolatum]|uniref:Uncharacterized protein n=1 Tax=Methylobacterium aerolatum TaxID=418708 RepID=A0ABU0HX21_9HYPH|nr:hypothetical protein [Methylobacterium aerolatum]MDQ0446880.1 hypothetical protein [Methylobacterium aerolatum]GJD33845.1 hypothetical protein FMGBMHLM_0740 [Methylobacterium aerolatum]